VPDNLWGRARWSLCSSMPSGRPQLIGDGFAYCVQAVAKKVEAAMASEEVMKRIAVSVQELLRLRTAAHACSRFLRAREGGTQDLGAGRQGGREGVRVGGHSKHETSAAKQVLKPHSNHSAFDGTPRQAWSAMWACEPSQRFCLVVMRFCARDALCIICTSFAVNTQAVCRLCERLALT
jgi:hypothetical protein